MPQSCPICGCQEFVDFRSRKNTQCAQCGSLPRMRVAWMFLHRHVIPEPNWRVLHLAPEAPLASIFKSVCNDGYDPVDLNPRHYEAKLGRPVRKLNLCTESATLPSDTYDLVVHNHVLEHLPCNVTLITQHLQRAVKPGGVHLFSIPIWAGTSKEDLDNSMSEEIRRKTFGHRQHMRRFGQDDFDVSFGPILGLSSRYTLEDYFKAEELTNANIPEHGWRCSGNSVFMVRKPLPA